MWMCDTAPCNVIGQPLYLNNTLHNLPKAIANADHHPLPAQASRADLKLLIMSATLDVAKFVRYFPGAAAARIQARKKATKNTARLDAVRNSVYHTFTTHDRPAVGRPCHHERPALATAVATHSIATTQLLPATDCTNHAHHQLKSKHYH